MTGTGRPAANRIIRLNRRKKRILLVLFLVICFFLFLDWFVEEDGMWTPDYPELDLGSIVNQEALSEEDYKTIFMQTGLGEEAVEELRRIKAGKNREIAFEYYQDHFFSSQEYDCRFIAAIVCEERFRDKDGNPSAGFQIPSLKNGDILITKSTHSLGWRHGHAAIVTDAATGETLEAIVLGNPTGFQNITKWKTYPSYIQLRLKDEYKGDEDQIAQYAKENIYHIPYGLFTGIPRKYSFKIKKTQCSHLVWYPYMHFGYDIDSDGSWLVTPKDIANSEYFQVVQVYGVNPKEIWP